MGNSTEAFLKEVGKEISQNYEKEEIFCTKEGMELPNRSVILSILSDLKKIMFPGYFSEGCNEGINPDYYVDYSLARVYNNLNHQIQLALRYERCVCGCQDEIRKEAEEICRYVLGKLGHIQRMLLKDVQAGFDGDPAANYKEEIILSYPGLLAIFVYRIAHELYVKKVPLIPRIMTEYAHSRTGIDINAGAAIGEYFFIDHGTGVVIGETTVIGNNVKLYQGVTLGALSTRSGQLLNGVKRHPTIEDRVTIYSNASILGGETVIGEDSVIGGNAFITQSVPKNTRVSVKAPELTFKGTPELKGQEAIWE